MNIRMSVVALLAVCCAVACSPRKETVVTPVTVTPWASADDWIRPADAWDSTRLDVFYVVSTNVLSARDAEGHESSRATLCAADRGAMAAEANWVGENMFPGDFNLSSPYYHQLTFDALCQLAPDSLAVVYQEVSLEVCQAFDYFMEHRDPTRPFVLAGFSQGARLVRDLLLHMTDEQYRHLVAAYMLGYRLSAADLQHPHIVAATGEAEAGVTISFNSVQNLDALWPWVSDGAVTCINPVNWRCDAVPASFTAYDHTNTVQVDTAHHVLIVQCEDPESYRRWMDEHPFFIQAGVSRDNLHHWDLLFYPEYIRANALCRAATAGFTR